MKNLCPCGEKKKTEHLVCMACERTANPDWLWQISYGKSFIQRQRAINQLLMHARKRGEQISMDGRTRERKRK